MKTQSIVALMLLLDAVRGQQWLNLTFNDCGVGTNPCNSPDLATLEIILYKKNAQYPFSLDTMGASDTFKSGVFRASSETVVFVYGYTATVNSDCPQQILQTYAPLDSTTNLFIVNTSVVYGGIFINIFDYIQAAQKTVCVGNRLAAYLAELHRLRVSEDNMHVMGHSLGAQTTHPTGVEFLRLRSVKLGRITGMDPAGPCFDSSVDRQLNKNDAKHVDIIHTNAKVLGTSLRLGHADFVPNGGTEQPGCFFLNILCSHSRCCFLYNESFASDQCTYAPVIGLPFALRYYANLNNVALAKESGYRWDYSEGDFEAFTNGASPFCRGASGLNIG